jgi:hypothetical protein
MNRILVSLVLSLLVSSAPAQQLIKDASLLGNTTLTGLLNLSPSGGTLNLGNVTISGIPASALTGTIADARLSGNVTLLGSSIDLGSEVTGSLPWGSITGTPTLGGAAALNVGTTTGTVASGDDAGLAFHRLRLAYGQTATLQRGQPYRLTLATAQSVMPSMSCFFHYSPGDTQLVVTGASGATNPLVSGMVPISLGAGNTLVIAHDYSFSDRYLVIEGLSASATVVSGGTLGTALVPIYQAAWSRTALGLGTAATTNATAYATAAQGTKADNAGAVNGLIKSNGSATFSAATDGIDYLSPTTGDTRYSLFPVLGTYEKTFTTSDLPARVATIAAGVTGNDIYLYYTANPGLAANDLVNYDSAVTIADTNAYVKSVGTFTAPNDTSVNPVGGPTNGVVNWQTSFGTGATVYYVVLNNGGSVGNVTVGLNAGGTAKGAHVITYNRVANSSCLLMMDWRGLTAGNAWSIAQRAVFACSPSGPNTGQVIANDYLTGYVASNCAQLRILPNIINDKIPVFVSMSGGIAQPASGRVRVQYQELLTTSGSVSTTWSGF